MKFLFYANPSPALFHLLGDFCANTAHIPGVGLPPLSTDYVIWAYAKANGFVIGAKEGAEFTIPTMK